MHRGKQHRRPRPHGYGLLRPIHAQSHSVQAPLPYLTRNRFDRRTPCPVVLVAVTAATAAGAAAARATAAGILAAVPVALGLGAVRLHRVPLAAELVELVALGVACLLVAHVEVKRRPVIGVLGRAV